MGDLAGLVGFCTAMVYDGVIGNLMTKLKSGTYVHDARQQLAEEVLNEGADYILWLDADMRFPPDLLIRLLKRSEPFVGTNYSTRTGIPEYTALKRITSSGDGPSKRCVTGPDSTGLEEVQAVGMGAALVHASVFRALHDPHGPDGPWFWYRWLDELDQQMGEDVYFCELVRDAGFAVYVDHDVSKDVAHVGDFSFKLEHAFDLMDVTEAARTERAEERAEKRPLEVV